MNKDGHRSDGTGMLYQPNIMPDQVYSIPQADDISLAADAGSWVEIVTSTTSSSSVQSNARLPDPEHQQPSQLDVSNVRRRRLLARSPLASVAALGAGGHCSPEIYEESESEPDRLMTSSNEGIQSSASDSGQEVPFPGSSDQSEDDDHDGTALGVGSLNAVFTPQPNAFSHPPSAHNRHRTAVSGSYVPSLSAGRPGGSRQRHSFNGHGSRQSHSPYNAIAPSHIPDHDAALRASLNTLLSCAAAARKKAEPIQTAPHISRTRIEASSLRMVPESVALGLERPGLATRRISSTPSSSQRETSPAVENSQYTGSPLGPQGTERSKRKAVRSSSKDRQRLAKKPKGLLRDDSISPTLLTWVVSAGVLVLVSALSFSAGYKVGRESVDMDISQQLDLASPVGRAGRATLGLRRTAITT